MTDAYVNQIEFQNEGGTVQSTHDIQDIDHADLARIDGAYEGMTVGNAEQLVSTVGITDEVPYNFRTSGGTADIGDREEDTIVGGTVAWNQLLTNMRANSTEKGLTFENVDGALTITGTITEAFSYNYVSFTNTLVTFKRDGSKYLLMLNKEIPFGCGISGYGATIPANRKAGMWTNTSGGTWRNNLVFRAELGETVDIRELRACIFDLTQMFGSTIADYIYSLEQANAGAGVAWFKKLFPKDYYEYNVGELLSVNTSAHNTVGFNAWDEEWEVGAYNSSTGGKTDSVSDRIRSKNFIPVLPNTTYYKTKGLQLYWYDADHNFVNWNSMNNAGTFTTPSYAYYMTFNGLANSGNTYNHDICINLSWDGERDGEYEPYVKHTYPLDSSLTLRGIPKLDSANNLYYDGDVYESDGTVTRKYGIVDLGTLDWTYSTVSSGTISNFRSTTPLVNAKLPSGSGVSFNAICALYRAVPYTDMTVTDKTFSIIFSSSSAAGRVWISDNSYTDSATFKAAMSGVYLVYELATPTTEEAEGYASPQIVSDWGTEEYVDYAELQGTRDVAVPVGHNTWYANNLRAKLEMSPDSPSGGDGVYCVKQTNGINEYVPLVIPQELPNAPSTDGSFSLVCTVTNGVATYSWVQN